MDLQHSGSDSPSGCTVCKASSIDRISLIVLPQMYLATRTCRREASAWTRPRPYILSLARRHVGGYTPAVYQDNAIERDLFLSVLGANVTRRDAKQFLARFQAPRDAPARTKSRENLQPGSQTKDREHVWNSSVGVKLGSLFGRTEETTRNHQCTHFALVCFRASDTVDDATLDGFAVTLSHLVKLGMQIVMILDPSVKAHDSGACGGNNIKMIRSTFAKEAERISWFIEHHCPEGARVIPGAFEIVGPNPACTNSLSSLPIDVAVPGELFGPMNRGVVLIAPSMASTVSGQLFQVSNKDILTGLCRSASIPTVDRILIVDPNGGIPNTPGGKTAHRSINLAQQLDIIERELSEFKILAAASPLQAGLGDIYKQHMDDLRMIHECLCVLPSSSSGLILNPSTAANTKSGGSSGAMPAGVQTRPKNILIYNLLTNKPLVPSSLPAGRVPSLSNGLHEISNTATLIKKGMPLRVVPAEQVGGWQSPTQGITSLKLDDDPRIDFSRLVHLINDSFRRKLDVDDYLARVRNRIAGVIVAGDYEGAAIFTWEMPPSTDDDPVRLVPYLDKFAVLQSSQGSNGVADILFQAMVETCFPKGVLWRSRKNNPVNKWYFERSVGSWQIPGSDWTMFWTGEGVVGEERWKDYVDIGANIRPSWADGTKPD